MGRLKVAVVILNWNGSNYLKKFLPHVIANSSIGNVEVVVADNGSTDDSLLVLANDFPSVRVIRLDRNYGYSSGYNLALNQVDAEYFVLLNSDVETPEGWLEPLIDFMDSHPNVGACMPKILDFNRRNYFEYAGAAGGFIDIMGYPYCRGRMLNTIEEDFGQYDEPMEIFWASGACMFVRAESFRKVDGLDDDFFAHMEEIDLCWRMKSAGFSVWCIPDSFVFHVGGGTLPNNNPHKLMLNYRNNLLMLYKNLPRKSFFPVLGVRFILDWASAIVYLITGRIRFALAVLQAHQSFWLLKSKMKSKRIAINQMNVNNNLHFRKLLLFDFFIRRRKTFR